MQQLSLSGLVALHLAPGAGGTLAYVILAGRIAEVGYPPLTAFLVAIAAVIVPTELAILVLAYAGSRRQGKPVITYRAHVSIADWAKLVPALLAAAVVGTRC